MMISEINHFLSTFNRSPRTIATYRDALKQFVRIVGPQAPLTKETYVAFLEQLKAKRLSPSTQSVYRTAVLSLYEFCGSGNMAELREVTKHYARRQGVRLIDFDFEAIEKTIEHCAHLSGDLLDLRDRAFVLLLVDTGLRISEACSLRRGSVDWRRRKAVVVGKRDKEARINVSDRAMRALKDYLAARSRMDGASGKPLTSLPLFARHDITCKNRLLPVESGGMWFAIKRRVEEAGLKPDQVRVHDLRHYAVSVFYARTNDVKAAQLFARHDDMATTSRYTHMEDKELERLYDEAFNRIMP